MPSTYTANGGIELPANGEQAATWGGTVNDNMQIIDRLTNGVGSITLSGTTHTLTTSDGALSDGQYSVLVFGGSPSGTNTVTLSPNDAQHVHIVKNATSQTVTVTQGSGGNVDVLAGKTKVVYSDGNGSGAQVVDLSSSFTSAALTAIEDLSFADGNFIVGNGSTWVVESGNTVLGSLGVTSTAVELNIMDGVTATTAELNKLDGVTWALTNYNALTASAVELNLLDGVTWTLTNYNALTASATELNLLDGVTSLTGADNVLVTGTAGTSGQYAQWNSDGDVVGVDINILPESDWEAGTSTTEALVTPAKVKAAIETRILVAVETALFDITKDTWVKRQIEQSHNDISGASISSNVVTLPSGTYLMQAFAVTSREQRDDVQLRIQNTTASTSIAASAAMRLVDGDADSGNASMHATGVVTLASTADIELQVYATANVSSRPSADYSGINPQGASLIVTKLA